MTLSEFLLERIAEDVEDITTAELHEPKPLAGSGGYWAVEERHGFRYLAVRRVRALAECEAKRRIVAYVEASVEVAKSISPRAGTSLLKHLAQPYADHPDYQQEWAI